jgi:hypothetical protein
MVLIVMTKNKMHSLREQRPSTARRKMPRTKGTRQKLRSRMRKNVSYYLVYFKLAMLMTLSGKETDCAGAVGNN